MAIDEGCEIVSGVTSQERAYGAITNETRTFHDEIDDTTVIDDALDGVTDQYPNSSVRVLGRNKAGKLVVEVQYNLQSNEAAIGVMSWTVNCVANQERTTVDVNGAPIVLSYPPSVDWAALTQSGYQAFQYTTYKDQTGEADVYLACSEITGSRNIIVKSGQVTTYLTDTIRPWQNTMNETSFFGFLRGNVLCLGCDFRMTSRRSSGDWVCEERYKFLTRPGSPLSGDTVDGCGWNTWHYWKDPNSGMIPDDVWEKKEDGAVVEVRHYAFKEFNTLLEAI